RPRAPARACACATPSPVREGRWLCPARPRSPSPTPANMPSTSNWRTLMSPRPLCYLIAAALSGALPACEPPSSQAEAPELNGTGGGADDVETLVDGIPNAENLVFTSTGRLLVTSDDGVFEIVQDGERYRSRQLHTGESCWFGGIVEI